MVSWLANGTCKTDVTNKDIDTNCKSALRNGSVIKEWRGRVHEHIEWRQLAHNRKLTTGERRKEKRRRAQIEKDLVPN